MNTYIVTTHGVLSVVFWIFVGIGATLAVYSHRIRDTTMERIALAGVAIGCFGTAWRVAKAGFVSEGGLFLSAMLAFYVLAIIIKHVRKQQPTKPADKVRPGEPA